MKLHFNLSTMLLLHYLNLITVVVLVHSLSPDGLSLLSLKSAISSPTGFPDWKDSDATPCHWTGVSCENITSGSEPRVVGLALAGKHLNGYIPSELGNLIYLRRLNLHDNNFQGSLPSQLFNATSLHSIFLYNNNFSGPLPSSLCNLPRLQNLDLSRNSFSGPMPHFLINCKQMQRLILGGNQFSGAIPKGIWSQLTNLIQLDLSSNHLNGSIPEDLGELQSLSGTLNLSFNHLSGQIPNTLGDLPMTVSFDLRHNNLSGEIPQSGSFASQGPTAFLNNPLLCGFPLQQNCNATSTDPSDSTPDAPSEGSDRNSNGDRQEGRGLKSSTIILISVLDAVVVAVVGLIIVYIYWKKFDDSNTCSCTGTKKLGGQNNNHGNGGKLCGCFTGLGSNDSDVDSEKSGGGYGGGGTSSAGGRASGEGELVAIDKGFSFELDELLRASAYVLGKSGLGIVYKVVLGNGIPVAVRRLGEGGEQRYKEFAAEIQAIGKVKHPNVVKLRAYYWAPDEKLLISDFINNGNLATALRGRGGQPSSNLTWTIRLKIAKGTARGLAYLHECSPRKYVHGDIKPSNILLDNDFQPYIADFGLNRLINITGSNNDPSSSGGGSGGFMGGALPYIKSIHQEKSNTYYRAPEARIPGTRPTQKWDIYSFGIVLFELLTGKNPENPSSFSPTTAASSSNSFASNMETQQDLVRWVRKGFEQESPLCDMVDPILLQEVHTKEEVLAMFHVALACTEGDPEIRPRMKTVSENLEKIGT